MGTRPRQRSTTPTFCSLFSACQYDFHHAPRVCGSSRTLGITAPRLKALGLIDKVVSEPPGGAHRDHAALIATLRKALTEALRHVQEQPLDALLEAREDKLLGYGKFKEITAN